MPRRPRGGGTITTRPDGRHRVRVRIGDRRPDVGVYDTREMAEAARLATLARATAAPPAVGSKVGSKLRRVK